jgi:hypothetical protein
MATFRLGAQECSRYAPLRDVASTVYSPPRNTWTGLDQKRSASSRPCRLAASISSRLPHDLRNCLLDYQALRGLLGPVLEEQAVTIFRDLGVDSYAITEGGELQG